MIKLILTVEEEFLFLYHWLIWLKMINLILTAEEEIFFLTSDCRVIKMILTMEEEEIPGFDLR